MNELDALVRDTLRADAQEAAMSTSTSQERQKLEARLDSADRRRRRTLLVALTGAAAVGVVAVLAWRGLGTTDAGPVGPGPSPTSASPSATGPSPSPTLGFTTTTFGVPFVADLPQWTGTLSTVTWPTSEQPEWVTWNRCPEPGTECIGLSFNRYRYVLNTATSRYDTVGYSGYLAYLDKLAAAGSISIDDRTATTVGGRPATLLTITGRQDISYGIGCHSDTSCDDFATGLLGHYAVVDTAGLDPEGEVLVIWTRAGAVAAAEEGWVEDFERTLTSVRFVPSSG